MTVVDNMVTRLADANARIAELERELQEQARLNGMGSEREAKQLTRITELERALLFYAEPETYFALCIIADPPCGAFAEDFSETSLGHKPGATARKALGL